MNFSFIHGLISPDLVQAICRTLLHSIWQGMAIAAIAGIIILCTRKTKAVIRYNLLSSAFACFLLSVVFTFFTQLNAATSSTRGNVILPISTKESAGTRETNKLLLPALQKDKFFQTVIHYTDRYASEITYVWLFFFLLQMARVATGLHYANRLKRKQVIAPPYEWQQQLELLKNSLGIRAMVSLMESGLVKVPVVIGILKPVVLVPLGLLTQLSPRQVETILIHELAHVRRRDFIVNILQRIAESFFFFNPFLMWLSARIREEREACCDDIVMKHINDKRSYLEALISFRQPEILSYGHAMTLGQKNNLLYRVKRMITQENKKLNAMEKLTLVFVLMATMAISFMPAQKVKSSEKKPDASVLESLSQQQPLKADDKSLSTPPKNIGRIKYDTVPENKNVTFKNFSSTINDDGGIKKGEVTATTSEGKTYHYRLIDNKIVEMTVDGKKINESDFHRYDRIVDKINAHREESIQKSLSDQKHYLEMLLNKQELLNNQMIDLHSKRDLLKQSELDTLIKKQELAKNDEFALTLRMEKLKLAKADNEKLLDLNQENDLLKKKLVLLDKERQDASVKTALGNLDRFKDNSDKNELLASQDIRFHDSNYQLSAILADLAEANAIADKQDFSFTLNNDELIVDGKKQASELFESLRKKYIKHEKDYFKYKAKQNSRSTDIYVE